MADNEKLEHLSLQKEFEWVLNEEVHSILHQLNIILNECVRRFPSWDSDIPIKQEKFVLSTSPDQLKSIVSISGDTILQADIQFKVQRHQQQIMYRTNIRHDCPWKLHQVQDAGNHLRQAILHIEKIDKETIFNSSEEVLHILRNLLGCLQRGRTSLIVPRKRTIDDLIKSRNMKCLTPILPEDLAISFYIQSHKLIFAVYQLSSSHGSMKYDTYQAECTVPWLNEVLVLFTVALQLAQQLKDKICVFTQYRDITSLSRPVSSVAIHS
ncbi:protein rogdi isoform X1 [Daktulosphaira vitifoliae]|uniref:protein rogdi isoform X1 n=1 Tax=Daktulosphaira vitifoliae TaxID=58002 RepID=UPI0021AA7B2A|nr:protein rogdi isoform X1 [Daktulosphaira vitifoliae]